MSYEAVARAVDTLRPRLGSTAPRVAVVLGSGLGGYADTHEGLSIPYRDIGFPEVTIAGHAGKLVLTPKAAILAGRVHYYEGHDLQTVVLPIRTLVLLGVKTVIFTNAAGGIRHDLQPGNLVVVRDHMNLLGANPLRGPHEARLGARFPDMSETYDPELRALALNQLRTLGQPATDGIYACVAGPSYETPAEIEMLRRLGADLVGMSTVPEALAASAMGARVLAISCVTNLAAGHGHKLSHREVTETAARVRPIFGQLLDGILASLWASP